jgi:hypothetical protein
LSNCGAQRFIPGRITTKVSGAGVYVECYGEKLVNDDVMYLQNNNYLKWVPAENSNSSTIPFAIKIKGEGDSYGYQIGRLNFTQLESPSSYTQVAKIHIDSGYNFMVYADKNGDGQATQDTYEELICAKTINITEMSHGLSFRFGPTDVPLTSNNPPSQDVVQNSGEYLIKPQKHHSTLKNYNNYFKMS